MHLSFTAEHLRLVLMYDASDPNRYRSPTAEHAVSTMDLHLSELDQGCMAGSKESHIELQSVQFGSLMDLTFST